MFYRMKFDGIVGKVLGQAGIRSTDEKFTLWPAGLTSHLVTQSKSLKLDAKSAAYLGMSKYFTEAPDISASTRRSILNAAYSCAVEEEGIGQDVCQKIKDCIEQLE